MRGMLSALAIIATVLAASAGAAQCPTGYGDVNDSGDVNIVDVQCQILVSLWELAGTGDPIPDCLQADVSSLDLNCDSSANVVDVQLAIAVALAIPLDLAVDANQNGCSDDCEADLPVVVIAEALYDAVGADSNTFVELAGPPGLSLSGLSLVGINGNGGGVYQSISLTGSIGGDGLYVVAHPDADPWITDFADQFDADVNYQNGPDSIQLRTGDVILDALGYGDFSILYVFGGEGNPAIDADPGSSLARDASSTDTDDNLADFDIEEMPSPGLLNGPPPNVAPVAALNCPLTAQTGQTIEVDASESEDTDGSVVSYTFEFGDGGLPLASPDPIVSHAYGTPGTYEVSVVVADDASATATASCEIEVEGPPNTPPSADLSCPLSGVTGELLAFDASGSTDAEGPVTAFAFDWDDDAPLTVGPASTATHVFDAAGTYEVVVTVNDFLGLSDTASCEVEITDAVDFPPVAELDCPLEATIGVPVVIDASSSSDAEGPIANFIYDFGDGSVPLTTSLSVISYPYTALGPFEVTLTVIDSAGQSGIAICEIEVAEAADPPFVQLIKPFDGETVTQGEAVYALANATADPGKSIASVDLLVDGIPQNTPDSVAPFEYNWVVPTEAETGTIYELRARAIDSSGVPADSAPRIVTVVNEPPTAAFSAVVSGPLMATFDASASSDPESPSEEIEIRWDFESDGVFDTDWSATKTIEHTYPTGGTYPVTLMVRDGVGQTDTASQDVSLSLIQYVAGDIDTTNWLGTVVVTGDIRVPSGETLTVGPGTSVLFVEIDQDENGVGDYGFEVDGVLDVQGTEEAPVTFTSFGAEKSPNSWTGIRLDAAGSSIDHAVIQYATVGLEVRNDATVTNTVLQFNETGVFANTSAVSPLILDEVSMVQNLECGLDVSGGTVNATNCQLNENTTGACVRNDGTLNLSLSEVTSNAGPGIDLIHDTHGFITQNQILFNDEEGVRVSVTSSNAAAAIRRNNIYGNALVRAMTFTNPPVSVTSGTSSTGTSTSEPWMLPDGAELKFLRYSYNEFGSSSGMSGQVKSQSGATLATSASNTTVLQTITASVTSLTANVNDNNTSGGCTMSVSGAFYIEPGASAEVSVAVNSTGTEVDLRENYFGTLLGVTDRVTYDNANNIDISGFRGEPFDDTWEVAPYYGGLTLTTDTEWSGTVYLTGPVLSNSASTLTVQPGTTVWAIPYSVSGGDEGDAGVEADGPLNILGEETAPVVFATYPDPDDDLTFGWIGVVVDGASSTLQWFTIDGAETGVDVRKAASLSHFTVAGAQTGVEVSSANADPVSIDDATLQSNLGNGLYVRSGAEVDATDVAVRSNGGNGIEVRDSNTNLDFSNGAIEDNAQHGAYVRLSSYATIEDSTVSGNQQTGLYYDRTTGIIERNNIVFNFNEGIRVYGFGYGGPIVRLNNIYGNALAGSLEVVTGGPAVTSGTSSTGTVTSDPWTTPSGGPIYFIDYKYSEFSSTSGLSGRIRRDSSSGTVLTSTSNSTTTSYSFNTTSSPTSTIVAEVSDSNTSGSGNMSVQRVAYFDEDALNQVVIFAPDDTLNFRDNYYGTFPDALSAIAYPSNLPPIIDGFVAAPFSTSFDKGNYWGGETITVPTVWSGEVIVTGRVTVNGTGSLTLEPGTTVRMVRFDANANGIGDSGIRAFGAFVSQGTEAQPNLITAWDAESAAPMDWEFIQLQTSTEHSIQHTTIEFADIGILLSTQMGSLANSVLRSCRLGIDLGGSSGIVSATEMTITQNVERGIDVRGGNMSLTESSIIDNLDTGVRVANNGIFDLSESLVSGNGGVGLDFVIDSRGTLERNNIVFNGHEGIRITRGTNDNAPTINQNNIFGNALTGATLVETVSVGAISGTSTTGTKVSEPWNSPNGEDVIAFRWSYSEFGSSSGMSGQVRALPSNSTLASAASNTTTWDFGQPTGVKGLEVLVSDNNTSGQVSATVNRVAYFQPGAVSQVTILSGHGEIDMQGNYFGTFPDPYAVLSIGELDKVDIDGFTGVPYDDEWQTANIYAGGTLSGDHVWTGDVYLTGVATVPVGSTLTVLAGTTVHVAAIDPDGNGVGSSALYVDGKLDVLGTAEAPVLFTVDGPSAGPGDWLTLDIGSTAGTLQHMAMEYSQNGLVVSGSAAHDWDYVTSRFNTNRGIRVSGGADVAATWLSSEGNGTDGVRVDGSSSLNADIAIITDNGSFGIDAASNSTLEIMNAIITGNVQAGIRARDNTIDISQCSLEENGRGLTVVGTVGGTVELNDIRFNEFEGIYIVSDPGNPSIDVNQNNIYGNCLTEGGVLDLISLSITSGTSTTGTFVSDPWFTPDAEAIVAVRYTYSESSSSGISGNVLSADTGGTLFSQSSSQSLRFNDIGGYTGASSHTGVQTRVSDSNTSGSGTMSVPSVYYRTSGVLSEMTVLTDSGEVDAQFNYWGTFPNVLERVVLGRENAADISGFNAFEVANTGPQLN